MKYLLTIKIPFEALDDIEARKKAREYIQDNSASDEGNLVKLQENFTDKPPRGIPL